MLEINILVFINVLILAAILIARKNNPLPNIILGFVILTPGLNFLNNINILTGNIFSFPWSYFFVQSTGSLFAPLFYFYVQLLLNRSYKERIWLYVISFVTFLIPLIMGLNFALSPEEARQVYISNLTQENYPQSMIWYGMFMFLLQLIYASFCVYDIRKAKKLASNTFTDTDKIKVKYLEFFILIIWVFTALVVLLYELLPANYVEYIILPIIILIINIFLFYYAFNFNVVFTENSYLELKESIDEMNVMDSHSNNFLDIDDDEQEALIQKIKSSLDVDKVFTNPQLNIKLFADHIGVPTHVLSKTINQQFKKSFSELIQEARVDYSIELLKEKSEQLSMDGIALESGFNSRSSFYRVFKKLTAKSPAAYIHELHK